MTVAADSADRRAQVIEAATALFWRKGYDGVSIGDLVQATGLNRYALYQAFGGKKEIFMAALDAYITESRAMVAAFLARPDREPIDAVRDAIVAKMLDPAIFPAGDLVCTTAADVAAKDPDVAAMVARCSAAIREDFVIAFQAAQKSGMADPAADPDAFAEVGNALYFSTGLQARMGRPREDLLQAIDQIVESQRYKPAT